MSLDIPNHDGFVALWSSRNNADGKPEQFLYPFDVGARSFGQVFRSRRPGGGSVPPFEIFVDWLAPIQLGPVAG